MPNHATRVLVVDDNYPSAMTLTWAMEGNGHNVRTCHNGRDAVEMALSFHPEVVLLDIGMPVMNGLEACRALRQQPHMNDAMIIAQTAWDDAGMRGKTLAAGFDFHLVKPIDLGEVERLVLTTHNT
ncbi:response regulator [Asticcacaulis benevestitus]|nr:response regulator [Asticcacaulis benevestitus]